MYNKFAYIYDELMDDIDYEKWYLYIKSIFDKFQKEPKMLLEMACGTGNLSYYFAKNGYDLTCFDLSNDMLSIAYNKLKNFKKVKILNQNMVNFNINKKFDAIISICDSINYILNEEDLLKTFTNVKNHINKNGIFIFDINSYYKLSEIIGDNIFIEDRGDVFYTWENYFDEKNDIVNFFISFFIQEEDGRYFRFNEEHFEKAYKTEKIIKLLKQSYFTEIYVFDGFTFNKAHEKSERISFVAIP